MKRRAVWFVVSGVGVTVVAGLVILGVTLAHWADTAPSNTNTTDTDRHEAYASLYLTAWRQDDGRGNATIAATLLTTRLRQLLLDDTLRSSTDSQIAVDVKPLTKQDVPIVVTLDAVNGSAAQSISDAAVQASLSLRAVGQNFTLTSLIPIVNPVASVNTNTSTTTTERMWLAVFHANAATDWMTLYNLQLVVTNLDGQPQRILTWTNPALLTDQ